jgi:hypothetical protein
MTAFRQHFEEQEYYYGKQFLISLVWKLILKMSFYAVILDKSSWSRRKIECEVS